MKPGFTNAGMGPFYCGDSVSVEGFLSFFPALRAKIEVAYVEFPRPRLPIADLLGEENQSIPVLVLDGEPSSDRVAVRRAKGISFITNERDIRRYLSATFELPEAG
jgi:hypothetical protein